MLDLGLLKELSHIKEVWREVLCEPLSTDECMSWGQCKSKGQDQADSLARSWRSISMNFFKCVYIIITLVYYLIIRKINFAYKNICTSSLISKLPFHFLNETLKAEQTANQSATEGKIVGQRAGQWHSTMRRLIGSRRAHELQNFHIPKFRFTVRLNSFFTACRQKATMLAYI